MAEAPKRIEARNDGTGSRTWWPEKVDDVGWRGRDSFVRADIADGYREALIELRRCAGATCKDWESIRAVRTLINEALAKGDEA